MSAAATAGVLWAVEQVPDTGGQGGGRTCGHATVLLAEAQYTSGESVLGLFVWGVQQKPSKFDILPTILLCIVAYPFNVFHMFTNCCAYETGIF